MIDYIKSIEEICSICDGIEESVVGMVNKKVNLKQLIWTKHYQDMLQPLQNIVQLSSLIQFNLSRPNYEMFHRAVGELLSYSGTMSIKDFRDNIAIVRSLFKSKQSDLLDFYSAFDEDEKGRINEAIHNYLDECNYSCIAMSVSAVESRLLKLMCNVNPNSKNKLEKTTLGQLIHIYKDDEKKINKLYPNAVPGKHKPLLDLCNTYRIFSVHPKKQVINSRMASSILNLSIEFLVDKDTKP